jgi:hypothetical protein
MENNNHKKWTLHSPAVKGLRLVNWSADVAITRGENAARESEYN